MTDLARDGVAVSVTCRVLGFSKQAYYRAMAGDVSRRDWDDAHLINPDCSSGCGCWGVRVRGKALLGWDDVTV